MIVTARCLVGKGRGTVSLSQLIHWGIIMLVRVIAKAAGICQTMSRSGRDKTR